MITGGSSGIGRAHAQYLGASGFRLLLAARRPAELARAAADLAATHGAVVETVIAGKPTWVAGRMNRLVTRVLSRKAMSKLMGAMLARAFGATHSLPAGAE